MASPIRIKRSAVSGKRPQLTDLQIGELALNTHDGDLFTERDTGGVGIGTTVSNLTPWTESYGASSISYLNSVGIGTDNPEARLDVFGGVKIDQLNVSGVSTFSNNIFVGTGASVGFGTTVYFDHSVYAGTGIEIGDRFNTQYVSQYDIIYANNLADQYILASEGITLQSVGGGKYFKASESQTGIYHGSVGAGIKRIETNGVGVTVYDQLDTTHLNISGVSTFAGDSIFNGNVSIAGTLTYEDVTNIDSIGIVTARNGLKVLAGGANIVGVVTATTFKGNGDFVDIDVDGHTELDDVNISGVVTATRYHGDENNNFLVGPSVGSASTEITSNIGIGRSSGYNLSTGSENILLGSCVGTALTTGSKNIWMGDRAGYNSRASNSILIGERAGCDILVSGSNIGLGYRVFRGKTGGGSNIAIGQEAGREDNPTETCSNVANISIGPFAGRDLKKGSYNITIGYDAGRYNNSCTDDNNNNIYIGTRAGASAGFLNYVGCCINNNVFIGPNAGDSVNYGPSNSSNQNVMIGDNAGNQSRGACNIFIGPFAGYGRGGYHHCSCVQPVLYGDKNIGIGHSVTLPVTCGSNQLAIGQLSQYWIVGDSSFNIGIGTSIPTSKLDVVGDAKITGNATVSGMLTVSQALVASVFVGSGFNLTTLNASNLGVGTIPDARFPAVLPAIDGSNLTGITASGTGVNIQNNGTNVGVAQTINFSTNLVASSSGGIATVTGAAGGGGSGDKISEGNTEAEVVDTGSDGHFKVTTEGSERLRIDSSGRVGIGTNNPDSTLHISSGDSGDCVLTLESDADNSGGENDNPYIKFIQDGGIEEAVVGINPQGIAIENNALVLSNSVMINGGIIFKTGTTNGYTNAVTRLSIADSGDATFSKNLNVTGISTLGSNVFVGSGATVGYGTSAFFPDNAAVYFGDSEDLKIYHGLVGGHSYIENTTTGSIRLKNGGSTVLEIANDGTTAANNLTVTHGINVSGIVTASTFVGDGSGLTGVTAGFGTDADLNLIAGNQAGIAITPASTSACYNILLGSCAGKAINSGDQNVFIGVGVGKSLDTQSSNVYIGQCVATDSLSGEYNFASGHIAARCVSGSNNIIMGCCAASVNKVNSSHNVILGSNAGKCMSGNLGENIIIGKNAGFEHGNASNNVILGQNAAYSIGGGSNNFIVGQNAACNIGNGANNIIVGQNAGKNLNNGGSHIIFGSSAGQNLNNAGNNILVGSNSGKCLTQSGENVYLGTNSGKNTTGGTNIAIGKNAYCGSSTGSKNIILGELAGRCLTSGSCNLLIGVGAGCLLTSGSKNIMMGCCVNAPSATDNSQLAIGHGTDYWITGNSDFNVGIGTTNATSKLDVIGDTKFDGNLNVTGLSTFVGFVTTGNLRVTGNNILLDHGGSMSGVTTIGSYYYDKLVINSVVNSSVYAGNDNWPAPAPHDMGWGGYEWRDGYFQGAVMSGELSRFDLTSAGIGSTHVNLTVQVATKSSDHRYHGQGSTNGYVIFEAGGSKSAIHSPFFTFTPGRKYRFDQSHNSNSSHQIKFYLEADRTTLYETGVTYNGTAGSSGAYTQIEITDETPSVLHYQCVNHAYMGNAVQTNSNVINTNYDATLGGNVSVTGISTFEDVRFANNNSIKFGDDTDLRIYHFPAGSGNNFISAANNTGIVVSAQNVSLMNQGHSAYYFKGEASGSIVYHNNTARVTTTSTGINVAGDAIFSGNVSVGGTLTYEDVTNVDSIGIVTARNNIELGGFIKHLGDTDTMIGYPSDNNIQFKTNNVERFRINNDGVGIGTNSPESLLHLQGTGGNASGLHFENDAGETFKMFFSSNTSNSQFSINYGGTGQNELIFTHNGNIITNQDTGNLGVGTYNPSRKYEVLGDSNLKGNLTLTGISTFIDDITFDGATAGRDIVFDRSESELKFSDSSKIIMGNSADLEIYHDGYKSIIEHSGHGDLYIRAGLGEKIHFQKWSGGDTLADFNTDGSIDLYYDNTQRFSTSGVGATVFGQLDVTSGANITGVVTATSFSGTVPSSSLSGALPAISGSNLTGIAVTSTDASFAQVEWDVVSNGSSSYRFTGPGNDGAEDNPDIYLVRGQKYIFNVNASGHPFLLRVSSGGSNYTDGVTNNGAETGKVIINVQHDAPAQLVYQCQYHGGMVGNIYIVGQHLANGADNRVITATSAYGLNGESNLTFNGSTLSVTGTVAATSYTGDGSSLSGITTTGDVRDITGIATGIGTFISNTGSLTNIDSFAYASTDYKTAEYTVHIMNGSNTQAQKVLVMQDQSSVHSQEYAVMTTGSNLLVSIGSSILGGNVYLNIDPQSGVSGLTTYRWRREVQL